MSKLISRWKTVAFLVAMAVASLQHANAALVLDLNTGGFSSGCNFCGNVAGVTVGWTFTVYSPFTINGLGVWRPVDVAPPVTQVGLWSGGVLLASATTSSASTPVASA